MNHPNPHQPKLPTSPETARCQQNRKLNDTHKPTQCAPRACSTLILDMFRKSRTIPFSEIGTHTHPFNSSLPVYTGELLPLSRLPVTQERLERRVCLKARPKPKQKHVFPSYSVQSWHLRKWNRAARGNQPSVRQSEVT